LDSIGKLTTYRPPTGEGIRVDDGFVEGMDIPIYYDPMLSKLVAYGKDRPEAIRRLIAAIVDYEIVGVATTLPFGRFVLEHEAFTSGNFDTHFVKNYFTTEALTATEKDESEVAAALALRLFLEQNKKLEVPQTEDSNWWKR
jgi:acetyl/propionyl-CoA carboxylase alpha subunit